MTEQTHFDVQFHAAAPAAASHTTHAAAPTDASTGAGGAANTAPGRTRRALSGWKRFFIDGAVWFLILVAARGVWSAGVYTVRLAHRFQRLIEWEERIPFDEDDREPPFHKWRKKGRRPLEAWIAANIPRDRAGANATASAMRETANLLRAGDLRGGRDAMAELTARLTPALDRARWYPFLTELSARMTDELGADADAGRVADLLDRAAGVFDGCTEGGKAGEGVKACGGVKPDEGAKPDESEKSARTGEKCAPAVRAEGAEVTEGAKPEPTPKSAAPSRSCPGGSCAAGYGYRYFY